MKLRQFAPQFRYVLISLVLVNIRPLFGLAQDRNSYTPTPQQRKLTPEQKSKTNTLIKIVRKSSERFKNAYLAEEGGYVLQFGCATGPGSGSMDLHDVNQAFVNRSAIGPPHPQVVIYRPASNRGPIGAEFLLVAEAWDRRQGTTEPIEQLVRYLGFSDRFGLPAVYKLHVWAWNGSPNKVFVNWHPNVSCELFGGQTS
jgi:hypothetical protein